MRLFREGHTGRAICPKCEALRPITYRYRTLPLAQSGIEVPDVLVSVCDVCDTTVGIPAQSLPKVQDARRASTARKVEARIPRELDDALGLIASRLHARPGPFRGALLRYYVSRVAGDVSMARRVVDLARTDASTGTPGGRISTRIDGDVLREATERVRALGLESESELYRGIVLVAFADTFDATSPEDRAALKAVAAAAV